MKWIVNKYGLCILCFFLVSGCSERRQEASVSPEIPVLDLERTINKSVPDIFVWNSLAKQSEMVPLQTTDENLLSGAARLEYIDEDCLFMVDYQTGSFYRFNRQGRLQKCFRYIGNGPGEYVRISSFFFDPVQQTMDIYDEEGRKRIRYDKDGRLVDETALGNLVVPVYASAQYLIFSGMPDTEYQLYVTDAQLNERGNYFPLTADTYDEVRRSAVQLLTNRSSNRDMLVFNRPMEDTVYMVTDKAVEPLFVLKKGKYDITFTDLDRFMTAAVKNMTCLLWPGISIIPGFILVEYQREGNRYLEIWDMNKQQIISRTTHKDGFPFLLPSGKKVNLPASKMYIDGNSLIFILPAEALYTEIEEVDAEDNPILIVLTV